MQRLIIIISNS